MFQKPDISDLRAAAQKLGMKPSDEYLQAVEQIVTPLAAAYATLDATPDELPAVKYPRGPFYRPSAEENPHGAWYMKTSIKGQPTGKLAGRRVALKDNVCLAGVPMMIGAQASRRLCAGRRRHHRRTHPRCRRRDRRQGGVRVLLRLGRQPHQFDRPGAQSAPPRLYDRRIVIGQRRARGRRRRRHGDRRRSGRFDPHPGEPLRHRRAEADLRACPLHRHRAARNHHRYRRPDDCERARQRPAAGGHRRAGRPRHPPAWRSGGPLHRGTRWRRKGNADRRHQGRVRPSEFRTRRRCACARCRTAICKSRRDRRGGLDPDTHAWAFRSGRRSAATPPASCSWK